MILILEYSFFFVYLQKVNSATLLLLARCQHYNADDFSDEPDFNIVDKFNVAN